ncbi:MAG: hypothetical protein WBE68_20210 [Candidatus Nitrosopolaris sp.]
MIIDVNNSTEMSLTAARRKEAALYFAAVKLQTSAWDMDSR